MRLASADPAAAPLIDPNYWSDPHDRKMSLEGLKIAREIMQQDALKPYVMAERLPGPKILSDDDLFDYACANAKTDHHPVGTCKMGTDAMAVVDLDLRYAGLKVCASATVRSCHAFHRVIPMRRRLWSAKRVLTLFAASIRCRPSCFHGRKTSRSGAQGFSQPSLHHMVRNADSQRCQNLYSSDCRMGGSRRH